MSKVIQIRNVPEDVHRKLKAKASELGMSLSDYLLSEITPLADLPTIEQWLERVRALPPIEGGPSSADLIRELRGPLP
jgi:antitoxin FitA